MVEHFDSAKAPEKPRRDPLNSRPKGRSHIATIMVGRRNMFLIDRQFDVVHLTLGR
jgi:hypothetical protein